MPDYAWLAGHHRGTMSFFPIVNHCDICDESEASIAPQSMANPLAESALVALKIATSVRTQQGFLVLTPHFAVKRCGIEESKGPKFCICLCKYTNMLHEYTHIYIYNIYNIHIYIYNIHIHIYIYICI